jgi:pimeloyl-ACP methyl ester carboxylesterase
MSEPPSAHPPLVRSNDAARDISAVVESIRRSRPEARVILFGWATGGQWAGYYASANPGRYNLSACGASAPLGPQYSG